MYFYFDIKKSYSKNRHVGRTVATDMFKILLDRQGNQIPGWLSTLEVYVPTILLSDNQEVDDKRRQHKHNVISSDNLFKFIGIKDLPEEKKIRVYCETQKTPFGKIFEKLLETGILLYINLDYTRMANARFYYSNGDYEWYTNTVSHFVVLAATMTMNLKSLMCIYPCDNINDSNIMLISQEPLQVDSGSNTFNELLH